MALPPEPKRKDFDDEESFLEARDAWRHHVGPAVRAAKARSQASRPGSKSRDKDISK